MKLQNLTTQKCLPSNTNKRSGYFLGDAVMAVKRFFLVEMPVVSVPNVEQSYTSIQCRTAVPYCRVLKWIIWQ